MKKKLLILIALMLGVSFIGISVATAGDDCDPPGTGSPGYWMNHPDAWPVSNIYICGFEYSTAEAIELMERPVRGDKWLTLFRAYIAARLNINIGNPRPEDCCISDVEEWLCDNLSESGVKASSDAWQSNGECLYWCLDDYNNGLQDGAPSRDTLE
jgi:hypothetical protein